jgi:hypothetical protein
MTGGNEAAILRRACNAAVMTEAKKAAVTHCNGGLLIFNKSDAVYPSNVVAFGPLNRKSWVAFVHCVQEAEARPSGNEEDVNPFTRIFWQSEFNHPRLSIMLCLLIAIHLSSEDVDAMTCIFAAAGGRTEYLHRLLAVFRRTNELQTRNFTNIKFIRIEYLINKRRSHELMLFSSCKTCLM